MHRNVELLIGRLATDPGLQNRFAEEPFEALQEQGLELTAVEMASLAALDLKALRAFTAALDTRLCRASLVVEGRPMRGSTAAESKNDSR